MEYLIGDGEHYRLLKYLSNRLTSGSIVIDAGTHMGHSALSLAQNENTKVISYDTVVRDMVRDIVGRKEYSNIQFIQGNVLQIPPPYILKSKVILLDIDPHNGLQELAFMAILHGVGFKGCLLIDDIHLNTGMRGFWQHTQDNNLHCFDITEHGHKTGTGLVIFEMNQENKELFGDLINIV